MTALMISTGITLATDKRKDGASAHHPLQAPGLGSQTRRRKDLTTLPVSDVTHWRPRCKQGEETAAAQQGLGRKSGPIVTRLGVRGSAAQPECQCNNHSSGESDPCHRVTALASLSFPAACQAQAE